MLPTKRLVECPNGHQLRVLDSLAGKTVKCPICSTLIQVPVSVSNRDKSLTTAKGKSSNPTSAVPKWGLQELVCFGVSFALGCVLTLIVGITQMSSGRNTDQTLASTSPTPALSPDALQSSPPLSKEIPSDTGTTLKSKFLNSESHKQAALDKLKSESMKEVHSKLYQIATGFQEYELMFKRLTPAIGEPNQEVGRFSLLSWRVHLLPFLGQKPLYDRFKLDEPWDSPANKPLIDLMPSVYRFGEEKVGLTRFQVAQGEELIFNSINPTTYSDISDGIFLTALVVFVGADKAVPWTCPNDFVLDRNNSIGSLGHLDDGLIHLASGDAAIYVLKPETKPETFLAYLTPRGRESVILLTEDRRYVEVPKLQLEMEPILGPPPTGQAPEETISKKLKQIGLGFLNYEAVYKYLGYSLVAPGQTSDRVRPSMLSWRVHLLPYLGQAPLYDRFKIDEPWDSPHNKPLLDLMPEIYRLDDNVEGKTCFQVFQGDNLLFNTKTRSRLSSVQDGLSNTLMVVVVAPEKAVPWTCPYDFKFDPVQPIRSLGNLSDGIINAVTVEGQPFRFGNNIAPKEFLALVTPGGGEVVFPEEIAKRLLSRPPSQASSPMDDVRVSAESTSAPEEKKSTIVESSESKNQKPPRADSKAKGLVVLSQAVNRATNLQLIGLAFHAHGNQFGCLPQVPPGFVSGVSLSWRVHLLPYLGQMKLYQEFRQDEPWDSPHNIELLSKIPKIYQTGQGTSTTLLSFSGQGMILGNPNISSLQTIADGMGSTLLAINAGADQAVPWTKSEDLLVSAETVDAIIDGLQGQPLQGVCCDGPTLVLPASEARIQLLGLATVNGREIVDTDSLRAQFGPSLQPIPKYESMVNSLPDLERARKIQLNKIMDALLRFESSYKQLPIVNNEAYLDKNGKPFLSWRVHLLPFLDQENLYKEFNLKEPWNSAKNKKLIGKMPAIFRDPEETKPSNKTRYQRFTGVGTAFDGQFGPKRSGVSYDFFTLAIGCSSKEKAVIWTQPDDLVFDPANPFACFGNLEGNSVVCAELNGTAVSLKPFMPKSTFIEMVSPFGGGPIPMETVFFGYPQQ